MFGLSKKTGFDPENEAAGVIPDPAWKSKNFNGEMWRIGDTYNTGIGQYGVQITPLQAVVGVSVIANGGTLLTPSILFMAIPTITKGKSVSIDQANFEVVKEGMRQGVNEGGTAAGQERWRDDCRDHPPHHHPRYRRRHDGASQRPARHARTSG